MSLVFPNDLGAWRSWQERQHRVRHVKGQVVSAVRVPQSTWFVATDHAEPQVVVAMDSPNPSAVSSLIAPLRHLGDLPVAVVAPFPLDDVVRGLGLAGRPLNPGLVDGLVERSRCLVTAGDYLPVGHATARAAARHRRPLLMVQHGALTPYAAPLPPDSTVLAWSRADAEFWRSGRNDVRLEDVGSQLLWEAGLATGVGPPSSTSDDEAEVLVYLGQGHAAELPRARLVHAALGFCRAFGATYRPHPSERDRVSRLVHAGYRRTGVVVDGSRPLHELTGRVVSVFSTGVLEAAAQGRDAWVDYPRPPAWLGEFWERYAMSRFGEAPTAPPPRAPIAPAERIAQIVSEAAS